jgi:hypothetical protein
MHKNNAFGNGFRRRITDESLIIPITGVWNLIIKYTLLSLKVLWKNDFFIFHG